MSNKIIPHKAPTLFGAKKWGDWATIKLDNAGTLLTARYIGSGRFTTAYKKGRYVYLYTFHNDFSKSILAQAWREHGRENQHLPDIARIGKLQHRGHDVRIYRAKHYNHVRLGQLSPDNKRTVQLLQEAHDDACGAFPRDIVRTFHCSEFNRIIIETKNLPVSMTKALEHLYHAAQDWGDHYLFDGFQTRNWGIDEKGHLILLDPMFDAEKIRDDYYTRKRLGRKLDLLSNS